MVRIRRHLDRRDTVVANRRQDMVRYQEEGLRKRTRTRTDLELRKRTWSSLGEHRRLSFWR